MFRTLSRMFLPNPLDWKLKKMERRGEKKILLAWNRGLGDIALGLYATIQRIREFIPEAEITFLIRENLQSGFSMLENISVLVASDWRRGEKISVKETLHQLKIDPKNFDCIIDNLSPTDWVSWQRGKVTPRLKWNPMYDSLWKKFDLPEDSIYVGVQVVAETNYGLWRNWPISRWNELFTRLEALQIKVLLFGFGQEPLFPHKNLIDLRGKTTLFELLSIVKHRCRATLLPDSGILSTIYYLDEQFPLQLLSLWADPCHGVLKQAVASPNRLLSHHPLIGAHRDLSTVLVSAVMDVLFPLKPLVQCSKLSIPSTPLNYKSGAIILAGGQGSRLGISGPKGTFQVGNKTLFEWICEKTPKENFPIAIMTSPLNHLETVNFFEKHHYFDREIYFFQQKLIPFLDQNKKPLLAQGPDGNGGVFQAFFESGVGALFADKNIDAITILPVDNPLANPCDSELISHHLMEKNEVTIQCIKRLTPQEPMGALVERCGKIEIVEYLDLDPTLEYVYANMGIMVMSPLFLTKMAKIELPLHFVPKQFQGQSILKCEKFIFDALPYAAKVGALCSPREACYAPVKSLESLHLEPLKSISRLV